MEPILFVSALFIGGLIGDITLRRGLVIYRFGLLIAFRWYEEDRLVSYTPVIRYVLILLFYGALLISVTWIVIKGYPDYIGPYLSGVAIMYFYGHTKSSESIVNTDNFVKFNIEYIKNNGADAHNDKDYVEHFHRNSVSNGIDDKNDTT